MTRRQQLLITGLCAGLIAIGVAAMRSTAQTSKANDGKQIASVSCDPTGTLGCVGFDNETNGFEPQDQFDDDRDSFDETEFVFRNKDKERNGGLGPVYNHTSCVACHQNAGFVGAPLTETGPGSDALSGNASQVSEIRAGHNEAGKDGKLVFRDAPGGSVIQQRAIDPRVQEHVPDTENIRTLRMATSVLGDGYVEAIADIDLINVRDHQKPDVRGTINLVPVVVAPAGGKGEDFIFTSRVGRFGWKDQEASLLNFSAGAYVTEMGITNPLNPAENSSLGRPVDQFDPIGDPEDETNESPFGDDVQAFTNFMRSTKAPPATITIAAQERDKTAGQRLFERVGCAECHVVTFKTAAAGLRFGDIAIPPPLGNKVIHPFSDFLLHDIGTGDGIVQTQRAEVPPKGLAHVTHTRNEPCVNITINYERLNALLSGNPDPNYANSADYRSLLLGRRGITNVPAAIRVQPAATTTRALLRGTEPCLLPLSYTRTTAQMIRTAPLWGLRTRPQLLHDGRALTVRDAIKAHKNQGERARRRFDALNRSQQQVVIDFLMSL